MMTVLVLGATGATGREVVAQALEQGHLVTVLVRHTETFGSTSDSVRLLSGDVADGSSLLAEAIRGQDAVISALGVGKSFKSGGLIARSAPLIVRAMTSQGVSRLIFLSACGVGSTVEMVPFVPRIFMRTLLRDIFADKQAGEEQIVQSDLNWTIVYPVMLTHGPRTGKYRIGDRLVLRGFPTVSRADVAHFLVRQLRDPENSRRGVLVSS
jgi:putative NADH-flavin reductase